jgi:hypothetical protein
MRREHPRLFKDRLVRALLDGSKTQTRRPVKPQPTWRGRKVGSLECEGWAWSQKNPGVYLSSWIDDASFAEELAKHCKYRVGDLIWCRETWALYDEWPVIAYRADHKAYSLEKFEGQWRHYNRFAFWENERDKYPNGDKWRPSIHMPKWACRLWLEITDVRVERIASISGQDAMAEGIQYLNGRYTWNGGLAEYRAVTDAFCGAWQSIYPGSWERNDWVFALTVKRTEAPK